MVDTPKRAARLADGLVLQGTPDGKMRGMIERLRQYTRAVGRDSDSMSLEIRLTMAGKSPDDWVREAETWRSFGVHYLGVNTLRADLASPQDHIDAVRRVKETLDPVVAVQ